MRTGYGLYKRDPRGKGIGKLLNIDLVEDDLWFSAWVADNSDVNAMPIKMSEHHKSKLREVGYEVRKIQFQRIITK